MEYEVTFINGRPKIVIDIWDMNINLDRLEWDKDHKELADRMNDGRTPTER